jgi:preprotein translocase subunit SecE
MFQKLIKYIKDSRVELKKVIWPTRKELINQTILVIAISLGVAIILGIIDFLLTKAIALIVH